MDDHDRLAERVQRGALRRMLVFAIAFTVWQVSYFTIARPSGNAVRAVDIVRTAGFLVWAAALLLLFASGGAWLAPRKVRAILDDELAQARRAASYRHGFWVMICTCFAGYVASMTTHLTAIDMAHVCLSAGVLAVLVSQLLLERGTEG